MAGEIGHWCGIDFIGGGLGAVDKIDGAALQDKEGFLVITPTVFAPFSLDVDSGAGESSPQRIAPNTNPGDKRWILTSGVFAGLTLYGDIVMPSNGTIGTVAGTLLKFATDELEITGCNVVIGGIISRTKCHVITTNDSAIDWSLMIQNLWAASNMAGTGVGLKLKTYSDSQTEQNVNKWTGIASESQQSPSYGKRVDQVFYTVADASVAVPTEKVRITGAGKVGVGIDEPLFNLDVFSAVGDNARIGSAELGGWPAASAYAYFGNQNLDHSVAGNYAIYQSSTGQTAINSVTGQDLLLRINNASMMIINAAGISMLNLKSGANQGAAGAAENELWIDTADRTIKVGEAV